MKKENRSDEIDFNERNQPVGPESVKLWTLEGILAREMVPITIERWPDIPEEVKDKLKTGICTQDIMYLCICIYFMEDPIAKRSPASPQRNVLENKDVAMANDALQTVVKESGMKESAVSELQKRLEISVSLSSPETQIIDELEDTEFLELASRLVGENVAGNEQISHSQAAEAVRDHWRKSTPQSIQLKELSPLLHDYQRLIARHHMEHSNIVLVHYCQVKVVFFFPRN
ncbi:protein GLUTELIN PRECURSOR ACCUMULATION 3-like isoform X2 [Camellia sinensis]|uniref:protein GLUTELIN PRECURSOR ACCUMULATION 3-like isoform X2 n=1 Tax=Camellia sinensis TaxID=4442 RepID=UPI001036269A|nr:protein GLUTELIN PRECURSOR ACCUMULATION 3-like isoform X2 [Camellia sinensis]